MSKELTITNTAIDFTKPEVVRVLKSTVAQGLTDPEFFLFAEHCRSTGLNPFKKEVWAIKAGGRLQVMTGINGFLALANAHPMFDGMTVEVDNDERPTKAICKVYRKDRKFPSEGVALMKEYAKETPIWRQMPRVMITKVAKSIALREAFPQELGGLYTQEEMPSEYAEPRNVTEESAVYEPHETTVESPETTQSTQTSSVLRYYKINPKAPGFDVWKTKIKQAGGRFDGETKLWAVAGGIDGLEHQECDREGNLFTMGLKKKTKPVAAEKTPEVVVGEPPKREEPPAFDDDDLPF